MNEKNRSMLRTLSMVSAGVGVMLALGAAGTSDFRDELQYADEETRISIESELISEQGEKRMTLAAMALMGIGAAGLIMTEKNEKQR